jgi:hypothetical protein
VWLDSLYGIGVAGHPMIAPPSDPIRRVVPLDMSGFPAGRDALYACLETALFPVSEAVVNSVHPVVEPPRPVPIAGWRRIRIDVKPDPLRDLDWLSLGWADRLENGGGLITRIDETSHPPIIELGAFADDPVGELVRRGFESLADFPHDPLWALIRSKLFSLRSLLPDGDLSAVHAGTIELISLLDAAKFPELSLCHGVPQIDFSPRNVVALLQLVRRILIPPVLDKAFPVVLVVSNGAEQQNFLRAEGGFLDGGEGVLVWNAPHAEFQFTSLIVRLLRASASELPRASVARGRHSTDFQLADQAEDFPEGGSVLRLPIRGPVDSVVITAASGDEFRRLSQALHDPHRVYYC